MRDKFSVLSCPSDEDLTARRTSYADVTERLLREFGVAQGVKFVSDTVLSCRLSPDGVSMLLSPEALEALARDQLKNAAPTIERSS